MKRQVRNVLAEIRARGLAEAVDRKTSALAEVDLVAIHRHDLLLAQSLFEDHGHVRFRELSLKRGIGFEEEIFDELLRDRAAALFQFTRLDVNEERADDASPIDAGMLEELAVLDRGDGVDQRFRQVFVFDNFTFFAILVDHRRDQLRLDLRLTQPLLIVKIDQGLNSFAVSAEDYAEVRKSLFAVNFCVGAGINVKCTVAYGIVSALVVYNLRALLVTDLPQVGYHVVQAGSRVVAKGQRRRINARRSHEDVSA